MKLLGEQRKLTEVFEATESEYIVQRAKLASAKAAKEEISDLTSKLGDGVIPLSEASLLTAIKNTESSLTSLDQDMAAFLKERIPNCVSANCQQYVQQIRQSEVEAEMKRQNLHLGVMDSVIDMLVDQAAVQEATGLFLEAESRNLIQIKETLKEIWDDHLKETDRNKSAQEHADKIKKYNERRSKKTLQPEDFFLIAIHKILTNTNVDPGMITKDDVFEQVSTFGKQLEEEKKKVSDIQERWRSQRSRISKTIEEIQKELEIGKVICLIESAGPDIIFLCFQTELQKAQ